MKPTEKELAAAKEIVAEMDAWVGKFGFLIVRRVCNRFLKTERERRKTKREIADLERKLAALKSKTPR